MSILGVHPVILLSSFMMKRQWLHDLSKFAAGLVAADFVVFWWLSLQTRMPAVFLGLAIDRTMLIPAMIVDIFILLILVHYGWNIGKIPHLKERAYMVMTGAIFTVVFLGHLSRVLYSGDLVFFGWDVPVFLSWLGVVVSGYLAYVSFYFASRLKRT